MDCRRRWASSSTAYPASESPNQHRTCSSRQSSPPTCGHSSTRTLASFRTSAVMPFSNSNGGGTMFKFVASDSGAPQKRRQVAVACESCRKRKKRCHHTESGSPSLAVSNYVHHSPLSTSPSSTLQVAPTNQSPPDVAAHQFEESNRVEGEHTETSSALPNPVETDIQRTEPIVPLEQSTVIQVYTFSSISPLTKRSPSCGTLNVLSFQRFAFSSILVFSSILS